MEEKRPDAVEMAKKEASQGKKAQAHASRAYSLNRMSIAKLKIIAERFYSKTLPYHNFEHVLETIKNAREIIEHCKKDCIAPDEEIIYASLLFHDAGYHENHEQKGYASKEDYSAAIAEKVLGERGLFKDKISKIKRAIIATHRYARWRTVEEGIIRAADLKGMAAAYETFRRNTLNVKNHQSKTGGIINATLHVVLEHCQNSTRD